MDFEWDENKRRTNLKKHGVDLLEAALIFEGYYTSRADDRYDQGLSRSDRVRMGQALSC